MSPVLRQILLVGLALLASAALYVLVFVVDLPLAVTLPLYRLAYVVVLVLAPGVLVFALITAWRRSRQ